MSEEGYSGSSSSEGEEFGHIATLETFVDDDGQNLRNDRHPAIRARSKRVIFKPLERGKPANTMVTTILVKIVEQNYHSHN